MARENGYRATTSNLKSSQILVVYLSSPFKKSLHQEMSIIHEQFLMKSRCIEINVNIRKDSRILEKAVNQVK
jgi:hypothetical protein